MRKIALIVAIVAVIGVGAFAFVYLPSRANKEAPGQQALKAERSQAAGRYSLELDGAAAGYLNRADGGGTVGNVVTTGTDKHLGSIKYEEFAVGAGISMDKAFYQWIQDSWTNKSSSKNGSVLALDFDYKIVGRRDFKNALMTETIIPAMDAASQDPAYITVKFLPEQTTLGAPGGADKGQAGGSKSAGNKSWLPANFKLTVDGLDATKVSKIESFSVKQNAVASSLGEGRTKSSGPGGIEFPNLKIVMPESAAQGWYQWFDDFAIKGNGQEKGGKLVFMSANLQTELGFVQFFNVGISRISPLPQEANSDTIAKVLIELYVERMELKIN